MMACHLLTACLLCAAFSVICAQQPPFIDPTPLIQGMRGENVTFACRSTRNNEAPTNSLQIYRNGAFLPFETSAEAMNRLWRVDDGSFSNYTFGPLDSSDSGIILRCTSAQQSSGTSNISVIFPPVVMRNPPGNEIEEVREGESFEVTININANPMPTSYTWTRDGMPVSTGNGITVSSNAIVFDPTSRQHAGMYVLTVTNIAGTGMESFSLNVTYPPEFVGNFSETFNCSSSSDSDTITCASYPQQNGKFLCSFDGNPSPMLSRGAVQVSDTSNVDFETGSSIAITNVVSNNAGYYTCNATFENYAVSRMFRFYVGGPPQAISAVPLNVSAENRYLIVNLTYDNSLNTVPAKYFFVEATLASTDIVVFATRVSVSDTFYNVSLDPLRGSVSLDYMLSVTVGNVQGNSTPVNSSPFTINSAKVTVLSASCILNLVLFAVAVLFF